MKSEQINELAGALAKAQNIMEGAKKDSNNPFFKSKYADLASVWEACRKPLADNGLSVAQVLSTEGEATWISTLLMHSSGQWIESKLSLPQVPVDQKRSEAQAIGSLISYFRRYSLASLVGIYQEDDDAEATAKVNRETGEIRQPQEPNSEPIKKSKFSDKQMLSINKWVKRPELMELFPFISGNMSYDEFNIVMKHVVEEYNKAKGE